MCRTSSGLCYTGLLELSLSLVQWFSECGPSNSVTSITWSLLDNPEAGPHPRPTQLATLWERPAVGDSDPCIALMEFYENNVGMCLIGRLSGPRLCHQWRSLCVMLVMALPRALPLGCSISPSLCSCGGTGLPFLTSAGIQASCFENARLLVTHREGGASLDLANRYVY